MLYNKADTPDGSNVVKDDFYCNGTQVYNTQYDVTAYFKEK